MNSPRYSRRALLWLGGGMLIAACGRNTRGPTSPPSSTAAATPTRTLPATQSPPRTTTPTRQVSLAIAGDVMLDRSVGARVLSAGPEVVFAGVASVLRAADLCIVNLECAIADVGEPQAKSYTFRAPPESVGALVDAGIDVVSLANNHALDWGPEALVQTRALCEAAGIAVVGGGRDDTEARRPAMVERNGLRIAVLGYVDAPAEGSFSRLSWNAAPGTPGVAWLDIDEMVADIAAAKREADHVVVMAHFGHEYHSTPSEAQRLQARAAIDAGATVVGGHHPHVLQPMEEYGPGVIAYSLGNFVFDGFDPPANTSAILRVDIEGPRIASYRTTAVEVVDGLPVLSGA